MSSPDQESQVSLSSLCPEPVKEKCQLFVTLGFPPLVLCPQTAIPSMLGFQSPVTFKGRETRRDIPQASRRSAGACGRTGTRPAWGAGQAAGTAVWIMPAGPVSSGGVHSGELSAVGAGGVWPGRRESPETWLPVPLCSIAAITDIRKILKIIIKMEAQTLKLSIEPTYP